MSDLPRLSGAELVARFGTDEAALRRYRMLVALLREGRSPGEVASTYGVSRESLRRLRHSFAAHGLAALQQRKRAHGHIAQNSRLATLIKTELDADPGVIASALWRRVHTRLHAEGITAPRSTFYRLLAQMRTDISDEPDPQAVGSLREALGALAEEPPLALGRSTLATLLLPDMRDTLQRGRALQRALRAAIKRLRPSEVGPVRDDSRWRHYLIIAGEYEAGEKRPALQRALALSASTYSRAKREALERITALLPDALAELPPPAPPATLIAPPEVPSYDDQAALDLYAARLRREGRAIIWGPDEEQTLELAAALAARLRARGQKVAWHACSADAELEPAAPLMLTLAAALALDGQADLWGLLHAAEPVGFDRQLESLRQGLVGRHLTIIVNNAHHLHSETAAHVLDILLASSATRDLRLVLVQPTLPVWATLDHWPALPASDDTAARGAFERRMARSTSNNAAPPQIQLSTLRERVSGVLASAPDSALATLNDAQMTQVLAVLQPLEQLIAKLRQAPVRPDE